MQPLTQLAAQKFLSKLIAEDALQQSILANAAALNITVPAITSSQILLSSAPPELADKNMQLAYPRVCIYSSGARNTQTEKFRSFSGYVALVAEIWASANLITQTDAWIHFYVASVANIVQSATGDWGDGMFYSGAYDVQLQPPKVGGVGFVESAKLTFSLNVSLA